MVKRAYVPKRGDLVWITLDPTLGHEQRGRRPALVLSPTEYNSKAGLMLVCPITSHVKDYPFEVSFSLKGDSCVILVDQIRSIDWQKRKTVFMKKCEPIVVLQVQEKLALLLGLTTGQMVKKMKG